MSARGPDIPPHNEEEESFYRLTFYEVLGVSEGATAEDIKRAYKKGILEHHPDKNTSLDAGVATRKFRRIQEAYEILADPQQRRQYDIQRNPQRHRYTSTPPSTTSTTQTFTHHHYHFRPPATTSSNPTTPKQSFSFMFSSSAQASFSFGVSSSSSTARTAEQNRDDDNREVLWSFTTRSNQDNERQPPSGTSSRGDEHGTQKYRNGRMDSDESGSSSEEEDEDDSVSSSE